MVLDVMRALGRRWYIVLLGLLLTAGLVFAAFRASPPEYHARGLVLLLPSESAVGKGGNPFLLLSGLEQPAGILVAYFSSAPAQSEVKAISPTAEYIVGIEDSTRGPVIAVDVTAKTPQETLGTLNHIVNQMPTELARLQQQVDAPENARIGSMSLSVDQKAQSDRAATLRTMIAALVIGLVVTALAGYALDSFLLRRRMPTKLPPGRSRQDRRGNDSSRRSHDAKAERLMEPNSEELELREQGLVALAIESSSAGRGS